MLCDDIEGILNTVGEVGVGWLSDQSWVSSLGLYSLCMLICGLVTALVPFVSSYPGVLALSAAYGFCISANYRRDQINWLTVLYLV